MLKALPTLLIFTPSVLCGLHTISIIYLKLRWAARFVANNYDWNSNVTDTLQHLQWEQLQHQRDNFRAIIMYKIINNLVDINFRKSLIRKSLIIN